MYSRNVKQTKKIDADYVVWFTLSIEEEYGRHGKQIATDWIKSNKLKAHILNEELLISDSFYLDTKYFAS